MSKICNIWKRNYWIRLNIKKSYCRFWNRERNTRIKNFSCRNWRGSSNCKKISWRSLASDLFLFILMIVYRIQADRWSYHFYFLTSNGVFSLIDSLKMEDHHLEILKFCQKFDLNISFAIIVDINTTIRNSIGWFSLFGYCVVVKHLRFDDCTTHSCQIESPGKYCLFVNQPQENLCVSCCIKFSWYDLDASNLVELLPYSSYVWSHSSDHGLFWFFGGDFSPLEN